MDHIASVRAALKAAAPVVAIPVEGRAPICVKARLLKGALKGVTIDSVKVLENGTLKVSGRALTLDKKGYAISCVRTSSTFFPIERWKALITIREWTIKERERRIKVINQGVLNAQTRRELLKKKIESEADNALKDAHKSVEAVCRQVREYVNPPVKSYYDEGMYESLRATRHLRKRGSVIQWNIKRLRDELSKITYQKGLKRGPKQTFAVKREYIPRMVLTMAQIGRLEAQFKALFPPVWVEFKYLDDERPSGYWQSTAIPTRPKRRVEYERAYDRAALAKQLREARADIRALTPPEDEIEQEQIAA